MITSLQDWMAFLKESDRLIGFPLLVIGAALMLFGWRLWKICVLLSFGLIGACLATKFGEGAGEQQWMLVPAVGIVLAGVSYFFVHQAVALLGGLIGGAAVMLFLSDLGLNGAILWLCTGVGVIGALAYAIINRRLVVIFVTAILGAVLCISGLAVFVMLSPVLYGTLLSMAAGSVIVLPFILLVPTVMSCFFQVAEVHRLQIEL